MRAPIANAVIIAQQAYQEIPNLMERTASENPERYYYHQTKARKILDEHPTRAHFDIERYHLCATQQEEKRDKIRHKEDKQMQEKDYLLFLKRTGMDSDI